MIPISIGGGSACTSSSVSWTNANNQENTVYVGDSSSNAFTFTPPSLAPTTLNCVIGTNSVTVLTKIPTSLIYGI